MTTDPAVTAVSEALLLTGSLPLDAGERAFAARVAVAAARPIIIAEALTDALHPEFGIEWREPDGVIWNAVDQARAEERERVARDVRKMRTTMIGGTVYLDANDVLAVIRGQA